MILIILSLMRMNTLLPQQQMDDKDQDRYIGHNLADPSAAKHQWAVLKKMTLTRNRYRQK